MKKEIEQRNNNELMMGCCCGGRHWIRVSYIADDSYKYFSAEIVDCPSLFWKRIKKAFKYIFLLDDYMWLAEVELNQLDLNKLKEFIKKYENE